MVSRAVSALLARDLIAASPNPDDKREMFLQFRPGGQSIYFAVVPHALRFANHLSDALSADEAARFFTAIEAILARLDNMDPQAGR